ncbi:MAG: ZIP family metal transporter [Candidatus Woesearchaeota archaeon]
MEALYIILLISIAGPIIGSLIGVMKRPTEIFMSRMLAFAAGVMISISFLELIPQSITASSTLICIIGVSIGAIAMYLIDRLIPHLHPALFKQEQGCKLQKTAVYLIIGIFMHNLPEGMAIATGTITNFSTTLAIAIGIAIHNIPEGICTSAPYYFCTKKKLKSFLISSSTAIPIVVGFLIAKAIFQNVPLAVTGAIVAATAGLMIYISCDELIPTSCNKCSTSWDHSIIFSLILGVLFVIGIGAI